MCIFWRTTVLLGAALAMFMGPAAVQAQDSSNVGVVEEPVDPAAYFADGDSELIEDAEVEQAALFLQQPPALSTTEAPRQPAARRTTSRTGNIRLASVPNMLGDCGMTTATVSILRANGAATNATFMLPMVGGSRTAKMAENDVSLPVDRVFFNYNHYTNAFEMSEEQPFGPGGAQFRTEPIDRYTLGFEKTFFDGWASVELRMPFTGSFDANLDSVSVSNGNVANLAVILKALWYQDENLGIGYGLGIDTPTGSDTVARLGTVNLEFENEAVHLLPYVGFLYAPGDPEWGWGNGWFLSGFLQFDFAAGGNNVRFADPVGAASADLGRFNEQNVLFADMALGYWLYRDSQAPRWTGLAVVGEVHYTSSIQDPDLVAGVVGGTAAAVTNPAGRFDVFNGTIGVQALLFDRSSLRVAGVFPMGEEEDERFFDSEVQVQFNRRF